MMRWLRGVLAIALLVSVYLLALALSVGLLALATVVAIASAAPPSPAGTFAAPRQTAAEQFGTHLAAYFYIGGITAVFFILIPVLRASRKTGRVRDSVLLAPADAPGLWAMVTELAATLGTRPPAELRVIAVANAEVSEECRLLGLLGGTRRLYVGLPLLLGMTVDELRAVLCHELGHYARSHTRTGPVIYRGAVALTEVIRTYQPTGKRRFRDGTLVAIPFLLYAGLYARLTAALRRQQEAEADAAAVDAAGQAAAAASLRSVHALSLAWARFLGEYATVVLRNGFNPDGLFDGFSAMLSDTLFHDVLTTWRQSPPDTPPGPFDSHPSIAARLRRIGAYETGVRDRDLTPAVSLLAAPPQVLADVQELALPGGAEGRPALPWPEWEGLVAEARAVDAAQELLGAARRVAAVPAPTLSTVLDLLLNGAADRLAAALAGGAQDTDAEQRLRAGLSSLVGCLLVQAGFASWQLSWTGPGTLTGIDIAVVEFPGLVESALRSTAAAGDLRGQLDYLGVPTDLPLAPVKVLAPAKLTEPAEPAVVPGAPATSDTPAASSAPVALTAPAVARRKTPRARRKRSRRETPQARRRRRIRVTLAIVGVTVAALVAVPVIRALTRTVYRPAYTLAVPASTGDNGNSIETLAFSPDGKTLATGDSDGQLDLWDAATGQLTGTRAIPAGDTIDEVAFSPDGRTLAAAVANGNDNAPDRGQIYLWNEPAGRLAGTFTGPGGTGPAALAFSPDGTTLATSVDNSGVGSTYLWDLATRRVTATLRSPGGLGVSALAFSPDGKTLAAADNNGNDSNGSISLWNVASRTITASLTGQDAGLNDVTFSPDGKLLAGAFSTLTTSAGNSALVGSAYLWNLADRHAATSFTAAGADAAAALGNGVESVAFSPDGKTLAGASDNGDISLWNVATRSTVAVLADPQNANVFSVAFSPDGKTLATGDANGDAFLWNATWP